MKRLLTFGCVVGCIGCSDLPGGDESALGSDPRASALVQGFMGESIQGEVKFSHFEEFLGADIDVQNCEDGVEYDARVYSGTSCASLPAIGEDFGSVFVNATCFSSMAWNTSLHAAELSEARIGGDNSILGRVAVIERDSQLVACGVIHAE